MSKAGIQRWLRRGRLHRLHRGVYLLGHRAAPPLARPCAAVLACGPGATLSHFDAAYLWKLLGPPPRDRPVHVTVPARALAQRSGIQIHRIPVPSNEWTTRSGIRVTTPARTILDLAAIGTDEILERSIAEAHFSGRANRRRLLATLDANPRRLGVARLRSFLAEDESPSDLRTRIERRLFALLRRAGLPIPRTNAPIGRFTADFLWERQRLIAETDGWRAHSERAKFESDRRRDADLAARGYTTIRITWRQLRGEPEAVLARLAAALAVRNRG